MFVVAQLGARMHYAVPRILSQGGMLERLYTDLYAPRTVRSALRVSSRFAPRGLRRWLARASEQIPENKITSFPLMGLEYYLRQKFSDATRPVSAAYLWAGREFCRLVIGKGLLDAQAVYTFNSAGLELLHHARANGLFAVMEQTIAPAAIEEDLLRAETVDHSGWEPARVHDRYRAQLAERERAEWESAHLILCASEFVRDGINKCGGPVERCCVVPYGVESLPGAPPRNGRGSGHRTLCVLTVGAVGLRKGTPYVLAAARSLRGRAEFRVVGDAKAGGYIRPTPSDNLMLLRSVPRSEIQVHYDWADVFLLPSICEGSATVCYEALAAGLPVITTPNSGSIVRDGIDGYIVPIRSCEAIVERLERLASDRDLLASMSKKARERSAEYTIEKYGERLLAAIARVWQNA